MVAALAQVSSARPCRVCPRSSSRLASLLPSHKMARNACRNQNQQHPRRVLILWAALADQTGLPSLCSTLPPLEHPLRRPSTTSPSLLPDLSTCPTRHQSAGALPLVEGLLPHMPSCLHPGHAIILLAADMDLAWQQPLGVALWCLNHQHLEPLPQEHPKKSGGIAYGTRLHDGWAWQFILFCMSFPCFGCQGQQMSVFLTYLSSCQILS